MEKKITMLIALLLFGTLSHADDISTQIEAIRQAPPKERVEMMNRLKTQIAAMNEEQRVQALGVLQGNMLQDKDKNHIERRTNQNRAASSGQMQQRGVQPTQQKRQGMRE